MSDRNGSAAAHPQATAEPHDSQAPADHPDRLAAALVEPEEATLSRDEPPGTDFGGVGDWYERTHPRRGPRHVEALEKYVSLSGEVEAFDRDRAKVGWVLNPEPGADGCEVLGSPENPRALWRTEDNRWVLFSGSDEDTGREVTQQKAAWLLRCDREELPPGVPPVLKDPDRESGKPKQEAQVHVSVDLATRTATVGGRSKTLKPDLAAFLHALVEGRGNAVAFHDMQARYPALHKKSVTRLLNRLTHGTVFPELTDLIDHGPGKGGTRLRF